MKPIVYTAIPKFLVYGNQVIGSYVENRGFAVTTPWQYSYGMGGNVDYEALKESLNTLAIRSDEVWVFSENEGVLPHEHTTRNGLGITDGVDREISLAEEHDVPVRYFRFDAEEMTIEFRGNKPSGYNWIEHENIDKRHLVTGIECRRCGESVNSMEPRMPSDHGPMWSLVEHTDTCVTGRTKEEIV